MWNKIYYNYFFRLFGLLLDDYTTILFITFVTYNSMGSTRTNNEKK